MILGSSGSRGFWPELLQNATAAEEVLNISVIDSNFTQIRQMYRDLAACLGPEGMRRATFALAPSLGGCGYPPDSPSPGCPGQEPFAPE